MSRYHTVPPTVGGQAIEDACSGLEVACVLTNNQDSSWFMLETSSDVALEDILPDAILALEAYPAYIKDNCVAPWNLTHEEAIAIVQTESWTGVLPI